MDDRSTSGVRRRESWCQTAETRIPDSEAAQRLIDRVGLATLYLVSPEIPNLFHAFVGDPEARTDSKWDSPSGQVYAWRWEIGKREAAFYGAIVRKKPTWVSWALLPAMLRLVGESRPPRELYAAGELSDGAYRITQALEESGGVLGTGELRRLAGFPTGKEQRAAYLRSIEELDSRLLLARIFSPDPDDHDMSHALVRLHYPRPVATAEGLSREAAIDQFLGTYLAAAMYAVPKVLAKHLRIPEAELRAGVARQAR